MIYKHFFCRVTFNWISGCRPRNTNPTCTSQVLASSKWPTLHPLVSATTYILLRPIPLYPLRVLEWKMFSVNRERRNEDSQSKLPLTILFFKRRKVLTLLLRELFHTRFNEARLLYVHYGSEVWGHPENLVFPMKTHTFIYQINCKINIKYSQDRDEVIHHDLYILLLAQRKASFIASPA